MHIVDTKWHQNSHLRTQEPGGILVAISKQRDLFNLGWTCVTDSALQSDSVEGYLHVCEQKNKRLHMQLYTQISFCINCHNDVQYNNIVIVTIGQYCTVKAGFPDYGIIQKHVIIS